MTALDCTQRTIKTTPRNLKRPATAQHTPTMDTSSTSPSQQPFVTSGTVHAVPPNLSAFEPTKALAPISSLNTLLWIGGMFDTTLSVHYPLALAAALGTNWSVMLASLNSAGMGWGVSSIARDAEDMRKIVEYIKGLRPGGKVVVMGHSTGCQDCMEYTTGKGRESRPSVDGVILQAPVSDREAIANHLPATFLNEVDQLALKWCREGHEKDCLPNRLTKPVFGRIGITARRWLDVSSPAPSHDGADDFFSSDLPDARLQATFGVLPPSTPLLVLYSGSDESVPEGVDKKRLVQRWMHTTEQHGGAVDGINGGVVEGASHNLNGQSPEIVGDLVRRVVGFVSRLERGELGAGPGASRI